MFELLGVPINLVNLGGWGAFTTLAWVVLRGFLKGDIRTRREVDEIRADRDVRLAERDQWREAWKERGVTLRAKDRQLDQLLRVGEVSTKILTALPHVEDDVPDADSLGDTEEAR